MTPAEIMRRGSPPCRLMPEQQTLVVWVFTIGTFGVLTMISAVGLLAAVKCGVL